MEINFCQPWFDAKFLLVERQGTLVEVQVGKEVRKFRLGEETTVAELICLLGEEQARLWEESRERMYSRRLSGEERLMDILEGWRQCKEHYCFILRRKGEGKTK